MDIRQRLSGWQLAAPALWVQALVFAAGVAALQRAGVAPVAWAGLYLCTATATAAAARWVPMSAGLWLAVAGYVLLFSALFWGANFGLDALHGAHRHKTEVAQSLGGLELWLVLCPGAASLALGAAAQACWVRRAKRPRRARRATRGPRITTARLAASKESP